MYLGTVGQSKKAFGFKTRILVTKAWEGSRKLALGITDGYVENVLQVVEDVKVTMSQAVEPLESGIIKINETFQETIQSWGGKQKETRTKEDTYLLKADSGAAEDTGVVKTQETVEVIRNDVHGDGKPEAKVTTTSQISYTPGADGTESDSALEKSDRKSVLRTERSILVRSNSQVRTRVSRQQVNRL